MNRSAGPRPLSQERHDGRDALYLLAELALWLPESVIEGKLRKRVAFTDKPFRQRPRIRYTLKGNT